MSALDIKLFRDARRLWAQLLAIALVIGGGVATLTLAVGSHRSLDETRTAYYERYAFADVFALAKRTPKALVDQIAQIPGVAAVDARIAKLALLDVPGFSGPASAQFVSLPDTGKPVLNRLYLLSGRLPEAGTEAGRAEEVVVNESFAKAHGLEPGAGFLRASMISTVHSLPSPSSCNVVRRSPRLSHSLILIPDLLTPVVVVPTMFSLRDLFRNVTGERSGWQRQPPSSMRTWMLSMPP